MPSLFGDSFKSVTKAGLAGWGASAYFKVKGLPGFPVIISRFGYGASEKVQVIETFKEYIHMYAFGRAASSVQIVGHVLAQSGDLSAAEDLKSAYESTLRAFKVAQGGSLISISGPLGVIKGVAINLMFDIAAGQDNVFNFTMNFIVLDGNGSSQTVANGGGGGGGDTNSSGTDASSSTDSSSSNSDTTGGSIDTSVDSSGNDVQMEVNNG